MCIAIVKPSGKDMPTEAIFRRCFSKNRDGAGFAIMRGTGPVEWFKGFMDIKEFLDAVMQVPDTKSATMMFHFRIGTHGSDDNAKGLTHPFPITPSPEACLKLSGKCSLASIHNGVIYKYGDMTSGVSDTVNFINKWVATKISFESFDQAPFAKSLETEMGYSKFAIMGGGRYKLYGSGWVEDGGIHYSNTGFKEYSTQSCDPRNWSYGSGYGDYGYGPNSYGTPGRRGQYDRLDAPEKWENTIRVLEPDEAFLSGNTDNPIAYLGADFKSPLLVGPGEKVYQNFPTKKKKINWVHVGYLMDDKEFDTFLENYNKASAHAD